jgi:hypothetical protein
MIEIDYKKLYGYVTTLQTDTLKRFAAGRCYEFYDSMTTDLFRDLRSKKVPDVKFYMTDSTMKRVDGMDVSNLKSCDFDFLYRKWPDETGFIFMADLVHFFYHIGANHVTLVCFKGKMPKLHKIELYDDRFNRMSEQAAIPLAVRAVSQSILGSATIDYAEENPSVFAYSAYGRLLYWSNHKFDSGLKKLFGRDDLADFKRLYKELATADDPDKARGQVGKYPLLNDHTVRHDCIWRCIMAFLFLKTASVSELTFLPMRDGILLNERPFKAYKDYGTPGVIKVDSFFDETINVAGPFPVRGHFRKQQKKDAAGQWYHDLIYIDTFMKNGYHRKATMEKLENYKEKLF